MLNRTSAPQSDEKALEELIKQITDSETFRMAPMMRTLLLYLWKHRGESVGEYAIAVDALGRSVDFDPKADSTVRVQIARLRAKLKDFYSTADQSFPLQLAIPLGRHDLTYTYVPVKIASPTPAQSFPKWYAAAAACALAALVVTCIALWMQNQRLKATTAPPPVSRVWQSFLAEGKPSLVVVPSPLYFYWPEQQVYVRDLTISSFVDWPNSPSLRDLGKQWGSPELAQTYVGAMEMSAGVRLLQYLDKQARDATLIESRKFSPESVATRNTIFLGMPRTTAGYLDGIMEKTDFYLARVAPDVIRSRRPKPDEPLEFKETAYSADRRRYPAAIMFLPVRPEGTRTVLLLGRYLTGVTSMLVSVEGLTMIEAQLEQNGWPDAWELVVESEVYRDTLLKTRPVSFRAIPADFWNRSAAIKQESR
jgi:hypothetical protein